MADIAIPCGETPARLYYNTFTRLSSVLSILFNLIVLYICVRERRQLRIYGRVMELTAGFNVFYSLVFVLAGTKSSPIGNYNYYFTDSPLLSHSSDNLQHAALIIRFTTIFAHSGLPAMQFIVRYQILKAKQPKTRGLYMAFVGLLSATFLYSLTYYLELEEPSEMHRITLYKDVIGCNLTSTQLPTYSVFDRSSISTAIHNVITVLLLISSTVFVVYYGFLTWLNFKRHMAQATVQTRKLNKHLNLVLTFQAILPFLLVVFPTGLFLSGLAPKKISQFLGLTASIGGALCPLMDALVVSFIIPMFRRRIFRCFADEKQNIGLNTTTVEVLHVTT